MPEEVLTVVGHDEETMTYLKENDNTPTVELEPTDAQPTPLAASHDPNTPPALVEFMLQGWAERSDEAGPPIRHVEAFRARRKKLSAQYPGEVIIIPTGHEKVRSNDTHFRFRPASDFYYLTGNTEPDCVLMLIPNQDGGHEEILWVEPSNRTDATFFTDRAKGELWAGPRLGVTKSQWYFGVNQCASLRDIDGFVEKLQSDPQLSVRLLRGFDEKLDTTFAVREADGELATFLSETRLIKEEIEIEELQSAIESTHRGFEDVIKRLAIAHSEREVEGVFNLRARVEGNDVGYGTIAASGHHACVLHWVQNDGKLQRGDLLLLDAGVEAHSLYTADITRTLPISGKFSETQRTIYDLVYKAQRAGLAAVRPETDFMEPNRVAQRVLAEGLYELGILKTTPDEALKEEHQFQRRYSLHNVSHMLGLDVHDCAKARQENYKFGKLKSGMVLTVEPGLYFQKDDLTVPEAYRGIGIRIEDDVLVTESGYRNLSANIPTSADEVEQWMERVWQDR